MGSLSYISGADPDDKLFQYLIIAFVFIYEIFFSVSLGPVVWLYVSEILPEKGVALATLSNWTCCFLLI